MDLYYNIFAGILYIAPICFILFFDDVPQKVTFQEFMHASGTLFVHLAIVIVMVANIVQSLFLFFRIGSLATASD